MENILNHCSPVDTGIPDLHDFIFIKQVYTTNGDLYRGGGQCHNARLLVLGEGGMKVKRYQNVILLTYLRSVSLFINQYSDSMCFSSIFSLNIKRDFY